MRQKRFVYETVIPAPGSSRIWSWLALHERLWDNRSPEANLIGCLLEWNVVVKTKIKYFPYALITIPFKCVIYPRVC